MQEVTSNVVTSKKRNNNDANNKKVKKENRAGYLTRDYYGGEKVRQKIHMRE